MIRVAHDCRATEVAQELEALHGLRAALGVVPEADGVVDLLLGEVGQHRAERDAVPMDVGEER